MALEEYSRKRNFKETPEPSPGRDAAAAAGRGGVFCVQRHRARRLHYDLRLEFAGVLKSWALPKGPSLSPGAKVLAVQVEDHPLEYASFEGNIPAGNYGAGSVMLWDRGEWELLEEPDAKAQLARGDLKFRLRGARLRGAFALVRLKSGGKGNEWLLIKKRDEFADPAWDLGAHARSVLTGRTEEEIAAFYRQRPELFTRKDQVKVRHMMVGLVVGDAESEAKARAKMEAARAEVAAGASFSDVAARVSMAPTAASGGDLGWFAIDELMPEFQDQVKGLAVGQMSPVFVQGPGVHLILLEDSKKGELRPLAEVHDPIRDLLFQQEAMERYDLWLERLKARTHIENRLASPEEPKP